METQTQKGIDTWDEFISGDFLKPVNVDSDKDAFVVTDVSVFNDIKNNSTRPRLTLERNGNEWDFDLNKTNSVFLKNNGIDSPRQAIGCKLYFRKAFVRNPQTNLEVESLRICKVEKKA